MQISPQDLINGNEILPLRLRGEMISTIATNYNMTLFGPDIKINSIVPINNIGYIFPVPVLTYLSSPQYAACLGDSTGNAVTGNAVICKPELRSLVPDDNCVLLTDYPEDIFFSILSDMIRNNEYQQLMGHIDKSSCIEHSAHIGKHVYIEKNVYVGHNVVIYPNVYLGEGVSIKANSTIGGEGFQPKILDGKRVLIPHAGGVWLSAGVQIGSNTCIDKGLYGEFTFLGENTTVDNLVHIAHAVITGKSCALVAGSEVSGSVHLGDYVWLGPNTCINPSLSLGNSCYIGSGSVVVRDLPAHVLAYGNPARIKGWSCVCRGKLSFIGNCSTCIICGRTYKLTSEQMVVSA